MQEYRNNPERPISHDAFSGVRCTRSTNFKAGRTYIRHPWLWENQDGTKTASYLDGVAMGQIEVNYPKWIPNWLIILRSKIPV